MGGCKDQFTARRGDGLLRKQRKGDHGFCCASRFRRAIAASRSCGTGISQAATCSGVAPMKQSSQWPRPSAPSSPAARTGGPKTRQVMGRHAYTSQRPVAGSSAGHAASSAKSSKRAWSSTRTAEYARFRSPGKSRAVFREPSAGAAFDFSRKRGICGAQLSHSGAKARGVERVDGESSVAALRATDAAGQERSSAASCLGKRSIHNLHEFGIARGKGHKRKHSGWRAMRRTPTSSREGHACAIFMGWSAEVNCEVIFLVLVGGSGDADCGCGARATGAFAGRSKRRPQPCDRRSRCREGDCRCGRERHHRA